MNHSASTARSRRRRLLDGLVALLLLSTLSRPAAAAEAPQRPPNIVFFLADDLGYGDLGSYGQQRIKTPNLDRLAAEGMRLTQHYSGNAVCAPSRCVLMTGRHPGHAFIRDNRSVGPEGQYPIPAETVTLAKLLQQRGYATGAFGKWGLGPPASAGDPLRQGFDRFFGYNCQAVAHNHYPAYLWNNDRRQPLDNPAFSAHQRLPADNDLRDPASYAQYAGNEYAPDLIGQQALEFVAAHRNEPFFLFVPTTIPHLALQVPEDSLAEYQGVLEDAPYDGSRRYLPHFAPHAAYAAMITRMDRDVGRLMQRIAELGLAEETIFIFSSDNGPLFDELGGTDTDYFNSAGGLRDRKGSLYEGGIRVPCIVRWTRHIAAGETSDRVTGFEDWLPTLLELIGSSGDIPASIDGISFAPTLWGHAQPPREFLYREFPANGGQQSVRVGDWKAMRRDLMPRSGAAPRLAIELYDLESDPAESRDVSAEHPDVVAQLAQIMRREHRRSAEFPITALDGD